MSRMAVASARARLGEADTRRVDLSVGPHRLVADGTAGDDEPAGPSPLGWLAAALVSDLAVRARTHLDARESAVGEIEVFAELDMGPPTVWRRHLHVAADLAPDALDALAAAIERGPICGQLRPDMSIRTRITAEGSSGTASQVGRYGDRHSRAARESARSSSPGEKVSSRTNPGGDCGGP